MNSMTTEVATASIEKSNGPSYGNSAIGEQIKDGLQRTRARADALRAGVMRKAQETTANTDKAIHHHPYRAMGIAATAALIVGFLAARR